MPLVLIMFSAASMRFCIEKRVSIELAFKLAKPLFMFTRCIFLKLNSQAFTALCNKARHD